MFNRVLQVKMVKTEDISPTPPRNPQDVIGDAVVYTTETLRALGKDGVKVMATYILLDTFRKVLVARAESQ